jgi:succinate dehydrogenase / fumarate reductase, cytochrome b subunit
MLHRAKSHHDTIGDQTLMAHSKPAAGGAGARPLSPHLQIYRPIINMVASIVHRVTGASLYFGTILLAWWLIAAATSPAYFEFVNGIFGSWPGRVILLGYTWALLQHMLGGIRHLIWDTGRGFELASIDRLSWASFTGSIALTAIIWAVALHLRGAF